jgi:hypothetical protein
MINQQLKVKKNPCPNVILGDFYTNMLRVEWDKKTLRYIKLYSHILNKRYNLDGFIILKSSNNIHKIWDIAYEKVLYSYKTGNYHVVFNREVSELEIYSILAWLCLYTKDEDLTKWFLVQCIKGTFTLRIGFKGRKKPPKILFKYGNQDKMIKEFLDNGNFILKCLDNVYA